MQAADLNRASAAAPMVISVVAPAYNDEAVLPDFYKQELPAWHASCLRP